MLMPEILWAVEKIPLTKKPLYADSSSQLSAWMRRISANQETKTG